jgi:signal transduction protein with GAF and PtsI domain
VGVPAPETNCDLQRELEFDIEQIHVEEGIRSYCAVPLILRDESVGVITVLSSHKNAYSGEHAEFLQEVSNQFVLVVRLLMPACTKHSSTKLICPRCIASGGGHATAAKYSAKLSE